MQNGINFSLLVLCVTFQFSQNYKTEENEKRSLYQQDTQLTQGKRPVETESRSKPSIHFLQNSDKKRALEVLKEVLLDASSIDDINNRADIISRTSSTLWPYDKELVRGTLTQELDNLFSRYESENKKAGDNKVSLNEINSSLENLLQALSSKDSKLANIKKQQLSKIKESLGKSDTDSSNNLNQAKKNLDTDIDTSVSIVNQLIEREFSSPMVQYLHDLAKRDKSTADNLYQKSLTILSTGRVYNISQAINLSSYAFKEPTIFTPVPGPLANGNKGIGFGTFSMPVSLDSEELNLRIAQQYLMSSYVFLNAIFFQNDPEKINNPSYIGSVYFLVKKLQAYANIYKLDRDGSWTRLETKARIASLNSGLDTPTINNLSGYADRIANNQKVFQFDIAETFEKARLEKDVGKAMEHLILGCQLLVAERKYNEAEERASEINDQKIREQVINYIQLEAGIYSADKKEWGKVSSQLNRITVEDIQLLLSLSASAIATKTASSGESLEYCENAAKLLQKTSKKVMQVKGSFFLSSLFSPFDLQRSQENLNQAISYLNEVDKMDLRNLLVEVPVHKTKLFYPVADSGIENCLRKISAKDWAGTVSHIRAIKSSYLRYLALVVVCDELLNTSLPDKK